MSGSLKLESTPFNYTLVLSNTSLRIEAKHEEECLIWGTIIDDVLTDPETINVSDNSTTKFIANLEVDAIFDIFEQYNDNILDKNIKITFPTTYKNDKEHLCIAIDFKRSYGKQQNESKFIILDPINVSKDIIHDQKFHNFKGKVADRFEKIQATIDDHENIHKERHDGHDKMFVVVNTNYNTIKTSVEENNDEIDEITGRITGCNNEITALKTTITSLQQTIATLTTSNTNLNNLVATINTSIAELKAAKTT